jgi:hypothetical protein
MVVFIEFRFTRRQLPVLLGHNMQSVMRVARDEESARTEGAPEERHSGSARVSAAVAARSRSTRVAPE